MSFYPELDRLNLEELEKRFCMSPPEGEDYATVYYQEIAHLIRENGNVGIAFLLDKIDKVKTAQLQAILFALTEMQLEHLNLRSLLLSYLQDDRPMIVMEAIDGLTRLGAKDALERVLALHEHSSPYVRGSVLRFVSRLHSDKALPLLIKALEDPSFIVRENAADELGELEIAAALPHLHPLTKDPHPNVQQAAQTAIELLSRS